MIYKGEFRSADDVKYTVEIKTLEGSGNKELSLSESPVIIKSVSSGVFSPIKSRSCTVKFLTNEPYLDMYSADPRGTEVTVKAFSAVIFRGYVTPNVYSLDYNGLEEITLECVDALSTLKNDDWDLTTKGKLSFKLLIDRCLSTCGYTEYYFSSAFALTKADWQNNVGIIDKLYINNDNFFDDDEERTPWKMYTLLEEIAKYFGLYITTYNNEVYFMDLFTKSYTQYNVNTTNKSSAHFSLGGTIDWSIRDIKLNIGETFDKILINCNTYDSGDLFKDLFDKFLTLYVMNMDIYNEERKHDSETHKLYVKVGLFNGSNYRTHQYAQSKLFLYNNLLVPISEEKAPSYPSNPNLDGSFASWTPYPLDDISSIGCKLIKVFTFDSEYSLEAPSSANWENLIWFSTGAAKQVTSDNLANFRNVGAFPVLEIEGGYFTTTSGATNYLVLKGQYDEVMNNKPKDTPLYESAYPSDALKTTEYPTNTRPYKGYIKFLLEIGDKVYLPARNGSNWVDKSSVTSTYIFNNLPRLSPNPSEQTNANTFYDINNNIDYTMGIDESGYRIKVDLGVMGNVKLTFYNPIPTHWDNKDKTIPRWVVLKDFTIESFLVDENYNWLKDTDIDSDHAYSNDVSKFLNEYNETLRINTQRIDKPFSLSSVLTDSGTLATFYNNWEDDLIIPEELLVKKYLALLGVPRVELSMTTLENYIHPTANFTFPYKGFSRLYFPETQEWDLKYNWNRVQYVEYNSNLT